MFCNILVVNEAQFRNCGCFFQGGKGNTWQLDAELVLNSSIATRLICLYGLLLGLGVHCFRPTWPFLIVEVLATRTKFLERSSYCIVINYAITFRTTNVFSCFWGVMDQFQLPELDYVVIYLAFCLDISRGRMNGALNETRTHPWRFASLSC